MSLLKKNIIYKYFFLILCLNANETKCQIFEQVKIEYIFPNYFSANESHYDTSSMYAYKYNDFYLFRYIVPSKIISVKLKSNTQTTKDTVELINFFIHKDSTKGILFGSDSTIDNIRIIKKEAFKEDANNLIYTLNLPIIEQLNAGKHKKIDSTYSSSGNLLGEIYEVFENNGVNKLSTKWVFEYANEIVSRNFNIAADMNEPNKWRLSKFVTIMPRLWLDKEQVWFKGGIISIRIEKITCKDEGSVIQLFQKSQTIRLISVKS